MLMVSVLYLDQGITYEIRPEIWLFDGPVLDSNTIKIGHNT